MAVLALMARAGDRGIPREKILSLLWPDADEERGPRTLTQALYALRQALGSDDAIAGTKDLRLDPTLVSSDIADFTAAVSRGDDEKAASLYEGPFLDGFYPPGAAGFSRWADDERRAISQDYSRVLESLARSAGARGDAQVSSAWWGKLAALDPLNARVAMGLMSSLAAAGDRAGALRHARVYEALLEQELDLPPDREVVLLAERLRNEANAQAAAPAPAPTRVATIEIDAESPAPPPLSSSLPPAAPVELHPTTPIVRVAEGQSTRQQPMRRSRALWAIALLVAGGALGAAGVMWSTRLRAPRTPTAGGRVVAVGHMVEYAPTGKPSLGAPLGDLLATNLARVAGLRVLSPARMLELARQSSGASDTSASAMIAAARLAGATDLIEGTLVARDGARLRLDLRLVDLASGAIVGARSVEGADVFALVDSGTARLAVTFGAQGPSNSVADVTTRSDAAYRLFVEGVRRFYDLDAAGAGKLFAAALDADSSFAMAAYYWSMTAPDPSSATQRIDRAMRLSANASDRERLIIRSDVALRYSSPELAAYADTLAVRYPDEVKAQVYRGISLVLADDYLAAVPYLQHAIAMDSLALAHDAAGRLACAGCDAFTQLLFAYWAADSIDAAEREARRWVRLQPKSAVARLSLASLLGARGRTDEGLAELRAAQNQGATVAAATPAAVPVQWLRVGDYARADKALHALIESGSPTEIPEGHWYLAISEREQGRLDSALDHATRYRAALREPYTLPSAASTSALLQGQLLRELGRARQAVTLFDSISRMRLPQIGGSMYARNRAWSLAHEAGALAAAGDTGRLIAIADTVQVYGARSVLGRDQRLHHYVRGLLLAARGQDDAAINEFQSSIRSRTIGYTRASYELSAALLRRHRAAEAVAMLQPALRGEVEASNLYVSRTELHELLGKAWDEAGRADSASAHYAIVAKTWAAGDPPFRARADVARARSAALNRR